MKDKFKLIIAALMSFCMLGTMTACGDSDNDDEGTEKNFSAEYKDPEQKVYGENYYRNSDIRRADVAAKNIQNSAASALFEMEEEGKMKDIIKSDKPVILCSDKSKDINASGVDDEFYDLMHDYFPDMDKMEWFMVVDREICVSTYVKMDDNEFIGHFPPSPRTDSGDEIYEFNGMSFDEVYKQVVSENT